LTWSVHRSLRTEITVKLQINSPLGISPFFRCCGPCVQLPPPPNPMISRAFRPSPIESRWFRDFNFSQIFPSPFIFPFNARRSQRPKSDDLTRRVRLFPACRKLRYFAMKTLSCNPKSIDSGFPCRNYSSASIVYRLPLPSPSPPPRRGSTRQTMLYSLSLSPLSPDCATSIALRICE